jgi:hypothetical protein
MVVKVDGNVNIGNIGCVKNSIIRKRKKRYRCFADYGFQFLTVPANELCGRIYNEGRNPGRMPATLPAYSKEMWLDPGLTADEMGDGTEKGNLRA